MKTCCCMLAGTKHCLYCSNASFDDLKLKIDKKIYKKTYTTTSICY